ncbi:hypothetical protein [Devosia sediminis]|uniref:Uncharacterized protein n=1 Tax=Devosia sediminis TaxID=2798801 RepID=A0A934IXF8_9HYPH|nr:hypothetical protein [Devosia sediminis]MBJ3783704.1 hypothetical protein [Devosia sediminis]
MKLMISATLVAAFIAGASAPAQAQSLLGILGGPDDAALITLGSGDAGEQGLVNLGLGGDNQVLDLNVGNGDLARATVGSESGGLDANVDLLNSTARVGVGIGGDDLVDVDIGIGGGTGGGGNGGTGGNGGNGGNGGSGGGSGGGGGGVVIPGGSVAAGSSSGAGVMCQGVSSNELERLIQATRIDGSWRRARSVDVQKVAICPELRSWLAAALQQTGLGQTLRSAIASDDLVLATLNRSSQSADRVFAVRNDGSRLTVFVY